MKVYLVTESVQFSARLEVDVPTTGIFTTAGEAQQFIDRYHEVLRDNYNIVEMELRLNDEDDHA